jgi:hypothetical protein
MPHRSSATSLCVTAALIAAMACPLAAAQPASIAGGWRLETAPHDPTGCVIRGDAQVSPPRGRVHTVRLELVQTCPGSAGRWARETCEAIMTGAEVTMTCTVTASESGIYRPDAFELTHEGPDQLTGRLVDTGVWNTRVTWRRASSPLVS